MSETPLNIYNRLALYDLTKKNQFKSEDDIVGMARYYTIALFKIKEVKVAEETQSIIQRLVGKQENQDLAITYYYYQMKEQWSLGHFSQAV